MPKLRKKERDFLTAHELCRLATASKKAIPHVAPVVYVLDGDDVVIVTDYGTKKLKNLKENGKAALVVDDYHPNRAVFVEGKAAVYEKGKEYLRLLKILLGKFEYYRKNPWAEGEAPIIVVKPRKVVSWGL